MALQDLGDVGGREIGGDPFVAQFAGQRLQLAVVDWSAFANRWSWRMRPRRRAVPLYIGEFGTLESADPDSRLRWTRWVRSKLDRLDLPWSYWDFATDFGAFDRDRGSWRQGFLEALTG